MTAHRVVTCLTMRVSKNCAMHSRWPQTSSTCLAFSHSPANKVCPKFGLKLSPLILCTGALPLVFVQLMRDKTILTDSGGIQKRRVRFMSQCLLRGASRPETSRSGDVRLILTSNSRARGPSYGGSPRDWVCPRRWCRWDQDCGYNLRQAQRLL